MSLAELVSVISCYGGGLEANKTIHVSIHSWPAHKQPVFTAVLDHTPSGVSDLLKLLRFSFQGLQHPLAVQIATSRHVLICRKPQGQHNVGAMLSWQLLSLDPP